MLDGDTKSQEIRTNPEVFVKRKTDREKFKHCIKDIVDDMIIDLNGEIEEYGDNFDYRDKMRDDKFVKEIGKNIIGNYQKLVNRNRIKSFAAHWGK